MSIQYNTIENVPIASFETSWKNESANQPIKAIVAEITPTQDLHGYEYPWPAGGGPEGAPESNICPISGRTEASVIRSGNNLIPQSRRTIVNNGITYTENSDGSVTINGTASSLSAMNLFSYSNVNNLVPGQTYHMRLIGANSAIQMQLYVNDTYTNNAYDADKIFTIPTDSQNNFIRLRITSGASFDNLTVFPMISLVPITNYEARYGNSYNVTWQSEAGEVYAGTVDLISGTLSVTGVGKVFDGTESWIKSGTGPAKVLFRYVDSRGPCPEGGNRASSHFRNANVFSSTTDIGYSPYTSSGQTNTYAQFRPGLGITELADWKAWLAEQYAAGTPLECWWTISDPMVYQLAGQQIGTLLGANNVWADSGNIKKLMWQYAIFDLLQVFINGYDITDLIAFGGWQRERSDVDGPEAGRTLDAKMHRARVTTKMRYNVTCRPMLAGELASLERLIMPEYVTVKVIGDPYYGTWERTCYVNNTSAKYLIRKRSGAQWWGGITFPIIEV